MSTATKIQTDLQLPEAGIWKADLSHSTVEAVARHLMVSKVRGRFSDFDATITIAENPAESTVEAVIRAASINTGNEQRDAHLVSPDFLDVERYPEITFRTSSLEQTGDATFNLHGDLTIRGVTRPVVLAAEYLGVVGDPWGGRRAGFTARTEINREDFGMTWNQALEAGGVVVGKKITIELEVEAIKA
ncbi:MAG: hypothetical protein NVSMB57_06900 [Actinomycetota bacterium]